VRTRLFAIGLVLAGFAARASAEENRYNLHIELGPIFTVSQPNPGPQDPAGFGTGGLHIRGAFEYQLNERVGGEVAFSPDILFKHINNSAQPFLNILVGVCGKFWYSK
jgi:hypothetical protein